MRRRHRPVSTYRLQFNPAFGFADADRLTPYLERLGITDLYASPLLAAAPGSEHGYDTCDYGALNADLGSDEAFERLARGLAGRDMGLLLDFVPNHMGLDVRANRWWRSVLTFGPASPFADFFDIDWDRPELPGKVLLPILEDAYGEVLERGELRLVFEDGEFAVAYYERRLPLRPETVSALLDETAAPIGDVAGGDSPAIEPLIAAINGQPGDRRSFDRLHALLERQHYRLAHWKTSFDEINYRRFFDVNNLGAIRMENPRVFAAAHGRVLALIGDGHVTGLRLDHTDGLLDPAAYFDALQRAIAALPGPEGDGEGGGFYLVAEKILGRDELLPDDWQIAGTTGFGFLNDVTGLFIDRASETAIRRAYQTLTRRRETFADVAYHGRRLVTASSMASELNVLAHRLKDLADADRRTRDYTVTALRRAIAETVACLPVYRSYITDRGFTATDRAVVDRAIDRARRANPVMAQAVFLFLRRIVLSDVDDEGDAAQQARRRFAMRFQQFCAPVQAKGIEDTAFYRYHPLAALNEVGGDPARFGTAIDVFHGGNRVRLDRWRNELTTTATHDTKRGEDARARLCVLSEMPDEWRRGVSRWRRLNSLRRTAVDRQPAPDPNDEYLFYQALVASWPAEMTDAPLPAEAPAGLVERIDAFMQKAIKEAKTHTSWINQHRAYEDAVSYSVRTALQGASARPFLATFVPLARTVAHAGMINGLSQLVLKLAAPGVPDFYQGVESWHLAFADPDNRRPVDFALREQTLDALLPRIEQAEAAVVDHDDRISVAAGLDTFVRDCVTHWPDARIKLFITAVGLRLRRRLAPLFLDGSYEALRVEGPAADHVIGFARCLDGRILLAIVPRLVHTLTTRHPDRPWHDTRLVLPSGYGDAALVQVFTGQTISVKDGSIAIDDLFRDCPVAMVVEREGEVRR